MGSVQERNKIRRELEKAQNKTGACGLDEISILDKNLFFKSSQYPRMFKIGQLSPATKSGNLLEQRNWRPVVILNSDLKIVERCTNTQLKTLIDSKEESVTSLVLFMNVHVEFAVTPI